MRHRDVQRAVADLDSVVSILQRFPLRERPSIYEYVKLARSRRTFAQPDLVDQLASARRHAETLWATATAKRQEATRVELAAPAGTGDDPSRASALRDEAEELDLEAVGAVRKAGLGKNRDGVVGGFLVDQAAVLANHMGTDPVAPAVDDAHAKVRWIVDRDPASQGLAHPLSLLLLCPLGGCRSCLDGVSTRLKRASEPQDGGWVTLSEAARTLGVSTSTVSRRLRDGVLGGPRSGRRYKGVWKARLDAAVEENESREDRESERHDERELQRLRDDHRRP